MLKLKYCEFCHREKVFLGGFCLRCNPPGQGTFEEEVKEHVNQFNQLKNDLEQKEQKLQTERETTQEALRTSQEWHERQKGEIIEEWKGKLTNLIQQRKSQIHQEITLLKEILAHE
jgi:Skp family chaperone for outer membrane proteins